MLAIAPSSTTCAAWRHSWLADGHKPSRPLSSRGSPEPVERASPEPGGQGSPEPRDGLVRARRAGLHPAGGRGRRTTFAGLCNFPLCDTNPRYQNRHVRPKRFREINHPYFVTSATLDRQPLFANPHSAAMFIDVLYWTRARYEYLLLAFVVMPDHFHLLAVPRGDDTISQLVRFIKGRFARLHNGDLSKQGAIWQASFHDRVARTETDIEQFVAYIELNPVRAGLSEDPAAYPFSSANPALKTDLRAYLGGCEVDS